MLFLPHRTKLFFDYNKARRSVKRRIESKNKWFFMQINYLCISYVFVVDIFTRSFDDFISIQFLIAVFLSASPFIPTSLFINFGDFCQPPRLLHPPRLLFWPQFASLSVYSALPFYLKLESKWFWIPANGNLILHWYKKPLVYSSATSYILSSVFSGNWHQQINLGNINNFWVTAIISLRKSTLRQKTDLLNDKLT